MDDIVWFAVVAAVIYFLVRMFRRPAAPETVVDFGLPSNDFSVSVERSEVKEIDCFRVTFKGRLDFGRRTGIFQLSLKLLDVTSSTNGEQIRCEWPPLQASDSIGFDYTSEPIDIPEYGYVLNFERGLHIPIPALDFPRSGSRRLRFSAAVVLDEKPIPIFVSDYADISYESELPGYKDAAESRILFEESSLRLAVAIGKCDGKFDAAEQALVKVWTTKIAASYDDSNADMVRNRLMQVVQEASKMKGSAKEQAHAAALALRDAPDYEKLTAMEISAMVAGADDLTAPSESKLLSIAAKDMQLDPALIRPIFDKHLPVEAASSSSIKSMLGLDAKMSNVKKKELLLAEFGKWNQRLSSANPEVRQKAEVMLQYIAEERAKLRK